MPVADIIRGLECVLCGRGSTDEFRTAILALVGFALLTILLASLVIRRVR